MVFFVILLTIETPVIIAVIEIGTRSYFAFTVDFTYSFCSVNPRQLSTYHFIIGCIVSFEIFRASCYININTAIPQNFTLYFDIIQGCTTFIH